MGVKLNSLLCEIKGMLGSGFIIGLYYVVSTIEVMYLFINLFT
jgi:hypothetical protein